MQYSCHLHVCLNGSDDDVDGDIKDTELLDDSADEVLTEK